MGKYGATALRAAELLRSGRKTADAAWREAAEELFPHATEARKKVCPRETFLGLCEAGMIRGVSAGTCRKVDGPGLNREYAKEAARSLARSPELAIGSQIELWRQVMAGLGADAGKRHNAQMDVVLALWNAGLLELSAVHSH